MNKTLKFNPNIIEILRKQKQIATPRLFDDKQLTKGDVIDLLNSETGEKFAEGKIIKITEMTFEKFVSGKPEVEKIYESHRLAYKREIKPEDIVKWVELKILAAS